MSELTERPAPNISEGSRLGRKRKRSPLFLCRAEELNGEYERSIDFLLHVPTRDEATRRATEILRHEWSEAERHSESDDTIASFYNSEVVIRNLSIRRVTREQAIEDFTRA